MAVISPFQAVLYNRGKIADLKPVVAPPYDVINKKDQAKLYQRHPYNIIRIILGKEKQGDDETNNKYTRAACYLKSWEEDNILYREENPALYFCQQRFFHPNGEKITRKGFLSIARLENFSTGKVLPHEKTLSFPKADRTKLLTACSANFNPIISLYSDPACSIEELIEQSAREETPLLQVVDDDQVEYRIWQVKDEKIISRVIKNMEDRVLFIADGHHRYETALDFRDNLSGKVSNFTGRESFNYVMMYLTNMDDEGLVIFPTPRLVRNISLPGPDALEEKLKKFFIIKRFPFGKNDESRAKKDLLARLARQANTEHAFALYLKNNDFYYFLSLKDESVVDRILKDDIPQPLKKLDVTILEAVILGKIFGISAREVKEGNSVGYIHDNSEAVDLVKKGEYQAAILLNPTKIKEVREIAGMGKKMPQKSTYFYPKFLSGLAINRIIPGETIESSRWSKGNQI